MKGHYTVMVAATAAITVLPGCQGDPDITQAPVRTTYTFQGKVDSRLVGEWHTNPAPAALTFRKDGTVYIVAVAHGQGGTVINKLDGLWLVSGNDLLFKYRRKNDPEDTILKYSFKISGNTLNMVQAGTGIKSAYKKAK